MNERKLLVTILVVLIFTVSMVQKGLSCSMFKITMYGKTMVLSNFYPSQVKDENEIDIPFYQKGRRLLDSRRDTSISFCSSVMDTMHQEKVWGGGTMYTTIYDLNKGTIYLYFFHDYTHVVKYNLDHELKKGDNSLVIPDLLPENQKGHEFVNNYNEISNEIDLFKDNELLNDSIRYRYVTSTILRKDVKLIRVFTDKINEICTMWLDKQNYPAAIRVFQFYVKVSPQSWNAYDLLADAYIRSKQNELALANFEKSVELNPDNLRGKKQIEQLKTLLK